MSTKLYNGYKLGNIRVCDLNEFYLELRKEIEVIAKKKYFDYLAREAIETLDNLSYLRKYDYDRFVKCLINLHKESISMSRVYKNFTATTKDDYFSDEKVEKYAKDHLFLVLMSDVYLNEIEYCDTTLRNDPDCDYSFSLCVMPLSDSEILFTAYGSELISLLNEKIDNDKEFCNKYGLEYYGYWNNTDSPDGVSDKDWEKRKEDWDKVLAVGGGIPSKSGMGIDLFNHKWDLSLHMVMKEWEEFEKLFPTKKERIERKTKDILLTEFTNKKYKEKGIDPNNMSFSDFSFSEWMSWKKEFDKLLETDSELILKKENLEKELAEIFIDTTKENLTAKAYNIFDLEV